MAILPCRAKTAPGPGPDLHSSHIVFALSLLFSIPGVISGKKYSNVVVRDSDHQVLQALKHEFIDYRGILRSWNGSGAGACSGWVGIKCADGQVIGIQLPWKELGGRISDKIGQLQGLRRLSLHDNVLTGPVPAALGFLPKLRGVYLFKNRLSGIIPPSIGNCLVLQGIDLSNNQLMGVVPASLANSTRLYRVNLSFNSLSGPIPVGLSESSSLTFLDLSHNNLSGAVPPSLTKKFNSTAFAGNAHLCGYSSTTQCRPPPPSPPPPRPPPPAPAPEYHSHRKLSIKDIILITAGVLLIILFVLCCVLICCLIRTRATMSKTGKTIVDRGAKPAAPAAIEVESGGDAGGKLVHFDGPFVFTADDLLCATAEIMGKSAYGTAYKATLEDNNNQVLVKRLREKIAKGQKEFEAEVAELGRIRHPNILALRAYYLGPKGEKLLVYDYMSNGSLASFLHARGPETVIPWETRMAIGVGVARGLGYLHNEMNMTHVNLTSSNVGLDEDNNPKIGYVGLPRLMTSAANMDAIATAGAQGYRAPELSSSSSSRMKNNNVSPKSDVYSLGVIMLELLTGKSPSEATDGMDLPQWVSSIVKEEWTNEVFDLELMRRDASDVGDELLNTLKLALHCVHPSPSARPEVRDVVVKLEEIRPHVSCSSVDI